ncbi:MAG: polysaccharide pyruvyl transferase family protein [Ruminococcus sp.]|nr:polysaccharide pyruvyl transferase family protein [Ruminococcus sp.]
MNSKKDKVGILTFHNANNYGAVLQAYALQEFLKEIYSNVLIIDYKCEAIEKRYRFPDLKDGKLKNKVRRVADYGVQKIKYNKFKAFRENFFDLGPCNFNGNDNYDAIVVGSDQVWNYELTDFDWTYFLKNFSSVKKCSYAPSFGLTAISPEAESEIRKCLSNFDNLSIREETGRRLIETLTGREVPVVADPTLLLSKSEWVKRFDISYGKEDYILVYIFGLSSQIAEYVNQLSKKSKMRVVCIESSIKKVLDGKYVRYASPVEWVEYFANAKYVITNSFHGLMFSIIFEKQFFIVPFQDGEKTGSRINDMLTYLNLENRKIEESFMATEAINYGDVQNRLEPLITDSKNYLTSIAREE